MATINSDWYKRTFDITVLVLSYLNPILMPFWVGLWIVIPMAIWIEDRGPIFYRQNRVGKNGRVFTMLKFRSMVINAEVDSGPVAATLNDRRITKVGRILRATALDELPQTLNILRGEMSFVGPRAERPEAHASLADRIPEFNQRTKIKPGLTGLAQVRGGYDYDLQDKLRDDLEYMRRMSLWLDAKLIVQSIVYTMLRRWDHRG